MMFVGLVVIFVSALLGASASDCNWKACVAQLLTMIGTVLFVAGVHG